MQIIIDLDGTICTEEKTYSRPMAVALKGAVRSVNELYERGETIIIYSARAWQEYEMTVHWLKKNKIKYHQLIMGKPIGDVWIDDRAVKFDGWADAMRKINRKESQKKADRHAKTRNKD